MSVSGQQRGFQKAVASGRRMRARTYILVTLAGFLPASTVLACSGNQGDDSYSTTRTLSQQLNPDTLLTAWLGLVAGAEFTGCARLRQANMRFTPSMSGLTFVRNVVINGESYPAYGWHATSPLIALRHYASSLGPSARSTVVNSTSAVEYKVISGGAASGNSNGIGSNLQAIFIARGGYMTGITNQSVQGTSQLTDFAAGTLHSNLTFSISFQATPCVLRDADVVLDDVRSSLFSGAGSPAGEKPVGLRMNCPMAGTRVSLTITDSVLPGNSGDDLEPTADSTARGVRVQVVHAGAPVRMTQSIDLGPSVQGDQIIPLTARYVRTSAALRAGTIKGQAVITATYQ